MARDTRTGSVLEEMVIPALRRGGYGIQTQVPIGKRLGGGRHIVDIIAEKEGQRWIVSMKWQQVSGTAEQKVPFEVICLADAVGSGPYKAAYLVLGGPGWSLREWYVGGGLKQYLGNVRDVRIVALEDFLAAANRGGL